MRANRGRTKPERALASALWSLGLRYFTSQGYASLSGVRLPGQPDLLFPGPRIVLFLDGCFWHGCETCGRADPSKLSGFWREKIATNQRRDQRVSDKLMADGWTVIRIWEHEIRRGADLAARAEEIRFLLQRDAAS